MTLFRFAITDIYRSFSRRRTNHRLHLLSADERSECGRGWRGKKQSFILVAVTRGTVFFSLSLAALYAVLLPNVANLMILITTRCVLMRQGASRRRLLQVWETLFTSFGYGKRPSGNAYFKPF